ncbi:MAG: LacI family transcriptional regulator [Treponema sp.]|nr:LacI family transcriptional regulator [Treponema sp.]
MRVSHQSLADALGLSQSTVSRALNGNKRISGATREMVFNKAYEMGYFSDAETALKKIAPQVSKAKPNIGLIVEDICNPFFSDIISGVQDQCMLKGYNLLLANSNINYMIEKENIENFRQCGTRGLIIHSHLLQTVPESDAGWDIPRVFICSPEKIGLESTVGIDTEKSSFTATEYLIQLGHRQIVFIGCFNRFLERLAGFKKAHARYGISLREDNILCCAAATRMSGYTTILNLLKNRRDFTAIVCVNDFIAFGVLEGIKKCNFRVPEDFSVIGHDNVEFSGYSGVELTTINQPAYEIGKNACELLIEKIDSRDKDTIVTLTLESSLVIRKSCYVV